MLIVNVDRLLAACDKARLFIANGIEFGYIVMPDAGDPAHEALPALYDAISKARGGQ